MALPINSFKRAIFRSFINQSTTEIPGAKPQSQIMPILVGLFAAVGGFIYGYDTGIINSIAEMAFVRHQFASNGESFSVNETSIMVAILSLGTFFGAIFAPLCSDTIGRRWSIIISTFGVFMVGNICQVVSEEILLFCIGRFITGVSVGIISAVVPLYQAEASPKYIRGAIISTYQWAITWGLLVSSAVSQGTRTMNSAASYRIPVGLQFVWSMVLGVGMLLLPDTPRFFILKDDLEQAAKSLAKLRRVDINDPGLIEELVEIKASHDYEMSFGEASIWDCFKSDEGRPRQLKRMMTGIFIQAIQQCSGINFIFYYGNNFFARTGVVNSSLISFVTYAVNVLFTIPGILLVEIIGRRKILIFGGLTMTISNFIIGIVGVTTNSIIANKIMISFVCLFIASFAASWGPVVWVVVGEIFSLGVRGKAVALSAATNWLVNFTFAFITPYLVDTGNHTAALGTKIFFIWGGLNFVGVCFVYFMVYETKGLSLEQINELYRSCGSAVGSKTYALPLIVLNVNNPNDEDDEEEEADQPQTHIHTTTHKQSETLSDGDRHCDDQVFSYEQFQKQQRILQEQQQTLQRMIDQTQEHEHEHAGHYQLEEYYPEQPNVESHERFSFSTGTTTRTDYSSSGLSTTQTPSHQHQYQPGYTIDVAVSRPGIGGPPSIFTNSSNEDDDDEHYTGDDDGFDIQEYLSSRSASSSSAYQKQNEEGGDNTGSLHNNLGINNVDPQDEGSSNDNEINDNDDNTSSDQSLFEA